MDVSLAALVDQIQTSVDKTKGLVKDFLFQKYGKLKQILNLLRKDHKVISLQKYYVFQAHSSQK